MKEERECSKLVEKLQKRLARYYSANDKLHLDLKT